MSTAAYASPPRSARASSPRSPSQANTSIDSSLQALSASPACATAASRADTRFPAQQPPPPTLREILAAYATKGQGDRDMLIALLNAKAAEEARIAAVAALQQNVLQMQINLAAAQIRHQQQQQQQQQQHSQPKSPVSPTSPLSPTRREVSPSVRARKDARSHPYARRHESLNWTVPRRSWDAVSDERSTSEE